MKNISIPCINRATYIKEYFLQAKYSGVSLELYENERLLQLQVKSISPFRNEFLQKCSHNFTRLPCHSNFLNGRIAFAFSLFLCYTHNILKNVIFEPLCTCSLAVAFRHQIIPAGQGCKRYAGLLLHCISQYRFLFCLVCVFGSKKSHMLRPEDLQRDQSQAGSVISTTGVTVAS